MYSGVPKAGAPDFMSTFEVKVPIATGQPGAMYCKSAMAAKASASDKVTAPAMVTGAIAPARVKGVTTTGCPRRANRIAPSSIGWSCFSGETELIGDGRIELLWEKKLDKLEKFFDRILYTQVALNYKRGMNVVEITANVNGVKMRGEDYAPDLRKAFDKALKNIERQVKKHKSYLTDKAHMKVQEISFDIDTELLPPAAPDKDEQEREIVKRKSFSVDVMTPIEATMQMDLLGHSFFIFKNDESGAINVVYKREDGAYGLLEPK